MFENCPAMFSGERLKKVTEFKALESEQEEVLCAPLEQPMTF